MPGRVVNALIRREVETYRAQGLPEEALNLLETTLRSNPDLPGDVKAGFQEQVKQIQAELTVHASDEIRPRFRTSRSRSSGGDGTAATP